WRRPRLFCARVLSPRWTVWMALCAGREQRPRPRCCSCFSSRPPPPSSTLFPYTTLFRSLTSNKVWIATDRSRARRCVEACVYGTLDFVGYPRFPAPVEFIAAVIAYYVHPVNIQTACLIMEGAEFTENI